MEFPIEIRYAPVGDENVSEIRYLKVLFFN